MLNQSQLLARLEREAAHLASEMNLEFVDIEIVKEPTGRYLRIYIDREGGISLNELEVYHKAIRSAADDVDYDFMEVSSPGADRPLKKPADFERAMGQVVDVKLYKPLNGTKQFRGTLAVFADGNITVNINGEDTVFVQKDVAMIRPFIDVEGELEEAQDI